MVYANRERTPSKRRWWVCGICGAVIRKGDKPLQELVREHKQSEDRLRDKRLRPLALDARECEGYNLRKDKS